MAAWLDTAAVAAVIGAEITADVDTDAMDAICVGVADWLEDVRSDLLAAPVGEAEPVFTPTPSLKVGAAFLVWRYYQRRRSLGADQSVSFSDLAEGDADISGLLGIGSHGRFVFGAPTTALLEEES